MELRSRVLPKEVATDVGTIWGSKPIASLVREVLLEIEFLVEISGESPPNVQSLTQALNLMGIQAPTVLWTSGKAHTVEDLLPHLDSSTNVEDDAAIVGQQLRWPSVVMARGGGRALVGNLGVALGNQMLVKEHVPVMEHVEGCHDVLSGYVEDSEQRLNGIEVSLEDGQKNRSPVAIDNSLDILIDIWHVHERVDIEFW
jgi:hypothetical protein